MGRILYEARHERRTYRRGDSLPMAAARRAGVLGPPREHTDTLNTDDESMSEIDTNTVEDGDLIASNDQKRALGNKVLVETVHRE